MKDRGVIGLKTTLENQKVTVLPMQEIAAHWQYETPVMPG